MNIKRITALVLIVSLCLLSLPAFSAGSTYESDRNLAYYEILSKLGILPEFVAEKNPGDTITRGEFSYLTAAGFSYPVSSSERHFADVDYSKEYAGAVMSLYSAGIVNGDAKGNFYPEDKLTVADASVIITRALGYTVMADSLGGYPTGYQLAANKTGLFNGVNQTEYLSVSDAVRLVFNALTADRMEKDYSGKEAYEVLDNSSELYNTYGLKYTSGVVEKNEITALDSPLGYKTPSVQIDGVKYNDSGYLAQELLGYHADVLYSEEDNGRKNIFLIYASDENNTLRIDAEDIYQAEGSGIKYDVNGRSKSLDIDFNIAVIYNNIAAPSINGLDFIPEYGDILLVDNNGDNNYDVVFVNSYETYVAYGVTEDSIIDVNDEIIDLSIYEEENIAVYKNGTAVELDSIAPYDVVSVCRSIKNEAVVIHVSQSQVTGVLNELADEECVIGETAYSLSPAMIKAVNDKKYVLPAPGEEVLAYIDIKGNIIHFREALYNGMAYGYVMGLSEASGFDETVLRVINHLGNVDDLTIKEKVLVNQTYKYEPGDVIPYLKDGDNVKHQLIKYKKSGSNILEEICFEESGDIFDEKRLVLAADYTQAKKYWRPSGRSFDGLTPVTDETIFFSVPTSDGDKRYADKYDVSNYTVLQNDVSYGYKAYDAREAGVVSVILLEGGKSTSFDPETTISVISDVKKTLNANEEEVLSVQYMLGGTMRQALTDYTLSYGPTPRTGNTVSWFGTPDVEAVSLYNTSDGIGEGDVVFISLSAEGTISGIYKITDASKAPDMMDGYKNPSAESYKSYQVTYGKMIELNNTIYTILPEGRSDEEKVVPFSSHYTATRYTYVDLNERDVKAVKVTVDYLKRCVNNDDYRILTRSGNAAVLDCVIYKLKK
ncbi:MAG: S-layer homology domain-containing protein [Clostridia bacterium]|nr:S-layer homology domain-containing protein [Clostridia bacterium]